MMSSSTIFSPKSIFPLASAWVRKLLYGGIIHYSAVSRQADSSKRPNGLACCSNSANAVSSGSPVLLGVLTTAAADVALLCKRICDSISSPRRGGCRGPGFAASRCPISLAYSRDYREHVAGQHPAWAGAFSRLRELGVGRSVMTSERDTRASVCSRRIQWRKSKIGQAFISGLAVSASKMVIVSGDYRPWTGV